jgi:ribosomal protein L44E
VGRKRKANLEVEFELERQVKDLKQEVSKLKKILREKEKKEKEMAEPNIVEKKPTKKPVIGKECPSCGSKVKSSILPMGVLELCESACGYRSVKRKGEN